MVDSVTIARPYAKAIFRYALENNALDFWSKILNQLTIILSDPKILQFTQNPGVSNSKILELLLTPYSNLSAKEKEELTRLLILLVVKKRLKVTQELHQIFEKLRAQEEKSSEVTVRSFSNLSDNQTKKLQESLKKKLARKISLKIMIDNSLLGGLIIQIGSLVIDGSLRSKINKLKAQLTSQ